MHRVARVRRRPDAGDAYSPVLAVVFSIMGIAPFSFMLLADLDVYSVDSLRPIEARMSLLAQARDWP